MAKHYITLNANGVVLRGFSTDFELPSENDVCIREDGERHFELNGVVNPPMTDYHGVPLYKLIDGVVVERTAEERQMEISPVVTIPTIEERTSALESAVLEIIMGGGL